MPSPGDALTDPAKMAILQGRFEALAQRAELVEPSHIVLGVLHSLDDPARTQLQLSDDRVARLCAQLGGGSDPAILSTGDIGYSDDCHRLVQAAMAAAPPSGIDPLHLLLGAYQLPLSAALHAAGLTRQRVADTIAQQEPG